MKKRILISLAVAVYGLGLSWGGFHLGAQMFRPTPFAKTDNLQKVNEIQAEITTFKHPTIRYVDGTVYYIDIWGGTKKDIDYFAVQLAEKDILTDEVSIYPNFNPYLYITSTKPKKLRKFEKLLNKNLSKRLSHIEGVYSAQIAINIPENIFSFYEKPKPITANVTIETNKAFDRERIAKVAKSLLAASVPALSRENIKIDFVYEECSNECLAKTYYGQAKRAINIDKNYAKALKNLKKAEEISKDYSRAIELFNSLIDINKKIAKTPNNYKLYIERGDLENLEEYSNSMFTTYNITSNYETAIEDYKKALELNPKAYEVYEKLGDAYSETGWRRCDVCKLERDIYDEHTAISYYEKAIEHCGGNDKLYKKLGDRYLAAKDKKRAKETFAKIKNPQALEDPSIPKPYKCFLGVFCR
ncbi:MAG: tetratricopeptide repeat protein [Muribaculaceae bacterium]|nr:tetratricopeptide repeat protein [Muribaculaceae bacterium]